MKKLQARTTAEALAYLNKYKIQNPIEIVGDMLNPKKTPTEMLNTKPEEILSTLNLDHADIAEWKKKGQWFSLKAFKGANKKPDKATSEMLAILLDPAATDLMDKFAVIGGSGKGVATVTAAKFQEIVTDKGKTWDPKAHTLAQTLNFINTQIPNELGDGVIMHITTSNTKAGKESVIQMIHDPATGKLIPIFIVDNEHPHAGPILGAGYRVVRYESTGKHFTLVTAPDVYKARTKIEYRFYRGVPAITPQFDQIFIDVTGWNSAEFANCIRSWMDIGTGMGVWHHGNRVIQIDEVNGNTVYCRTTTVATGNLTADTDYVSIRELGGKV